MTDSLKKISDFFKEKYFIVIFMLCLLGAGIKNVITFKRMDLPYLQIGAALVLLSTLLLVIFFFAKKVSVSISTKFLVAVLVLGSIYMFVIPVDAVPDEHTHYLRTYSVANEILRLKPEDGKLLMREVDAVADNKTKYESKNEYNEYFCKFKNEFFTGKSEYKGYKIGLMKGYSLPYVVPAIGMIIGRVLNLGYISCYMMARLFNLIFFAIVMTYAVKKIPVFKEGLFAIGLLPIVMQQGMSLSYDVMLIACTTASFSLLLKGYCEVETMSRLDWVLFGVFSFSVIPLKGYAYVLIGIQPLVLMTYRMIKNKSLKDVSLIGPIAGILGMILTKICKAIISYDNLYPVGDMFSSSLPIFKSNIIYWYGQEGYNLMMFIRNPVKLIDILVNTLYKYGGEYWETSIGSALGWYCIEPPKFFIYLLMICLPIVFLKKKSEVIRIDRIIKVDFLFIVLVTIGFILVGMLLGWTPQALNYIAGCQGRYFIPLIMFSLPLVHVREIEIPQKIQENILGFVLFIECMIINTVLYVI